MVYCRHCGAQMDDNAAYCPKCGAAANPEAKQAVPLESNDIADNKAISILSYLGPLVFIPLFARKNSPFAQFHAKQGVTLLALNILCTIVNSLLGMIQFTRGSLFGGFVTYVPWYIQTVRYSRGPGGGPVAVLGCSLVEEVLKSPVRGKGG